MLLEGLKVVELSTWIAGPGCAMIMADWGAEVIKVESPAGDPTRAFLIDQGLLPKESARKRPTKPPKPAAAPAAAAPTEPSAPEPAVAATTEEA